MKAKTRIDAPWLARSQTQRVFAALRAAGFDARAVGGAVRNTLMGRDVTDVDIATTALPDATMAAAVRAGLGVVPTGLAHGTVTVIADGEPYEVTTLRRDIETDGRHAVVAFTDDWAADAARRDFTINALYCDADGLIHDPRNGYDDVMARRVRFIGAASDRIREDHLRILRFFRFSAAYGAGPIDAAGLAACNERRHGLQQLSAERIRAELMKLLVATRAADIASLMADHGYWPALLGVAVRPQQLPRRAAFDAERGLPANALERLALLAIEVPEDAERLATRLRLSNEDRNTLLAIGRLAPQLSTTIGQVALAEQLYRHGRTHLRAALHVAEARWPGDWTQIIAATETQPIPILPIRGQDLIDQGMAPGAALGAMLQGLETRWIAGGFKLTRKDLLDLMEKDA